MNDLKEIGGFIVSADPYVNHDNSLSGNGTLTSPLGVVPGYNETVLWSGSTTASGEVMNLSEPLTNFERVRVKSNAWERIFYNEIDNTQNRLDFGNMWCLSDGTHVQYVGHSYSANADKDKLVWVASNTAYLPNVGSKSWSTAYQLLEIRGINRKQNGGN